MHSHFHIPCRRAVLSAALAFAMLICAGVWQVAKGDVGQPQPTSFAGRFSDDKLTLELSEAGGAYVGTITLEDKQFPAKAGATGANLAGTFIASGSEFAFTATFADGRLMLVSGGKTYSLAKVAINPLPQAGAPGNGASGAGEAFGGFTVLGQTPAGKTLFIKLPAAQTLEAAMTQTADELGKVLDAKPALGNAFAEAKGKNKGHVSLTGKLKGQEIRGLIFCGSDKDTASATVVFAAANAPKAEIAALFGFMPALPVKMTTHKFPDGSGSIDLPDGWTTPDETAAHGIGVGGPAGQRVLWHGVLNISEPECGTVKMGRQTYQIQLKNYEYSLRQYQQLLAMHQRNPNSPVPQRPPQPPVEPNADPNIQYPGMNFCRQCDGMEDVIKYWYPIREEKQKRGGKGYSDVDKVIAVFPGDPNPYIANSKSGSAYLAATDHIGDTVTHVRVLVQVTTAPVLEGESWQMFTSTMRAPDESFDRDLPVMTAIMNSINLDMDVVNKRIGDDGGKVRKIFADKFQVMVKAGQDFQDRQAIQFADHERQIAAQEQARHDSASDFIEYIGGVRKVYDTQTGKMLDVDLFNSNAITDGLNAGANNPNQFVQVPLRYLR